MGTFRKSEFLSFPSTESDLNAHGNTPESRFCLVSVDVSFRKQVFFSLLVAFYRALTALVIPDLPLSLQER